MPLFIEPKEGGRFQAWTGDPVRLVAARGTAVSAKVVEAWSELIDEETRRSESFTWIACRDLVGRAGRLQGLVLEASAVPELGKIPEAVRVEKAEGSKPPARSGSKKDLQAVKMRVAAVLQCARSRVLIVLMPLKGDRAS